MDFHYYLEAAFLQLAMQLVGLTPLKHILQILNKTEVFEDYLDEHSVTQQNCSSQSHLACSWTSGSQLLPNHGTWVRREGGFCNILTLPAFPPSYSPTSCSCLSLSEWKTLQNEKFILAFLFCFFFNNEKKKKKIISFPGEILSLWCSSSELSLLNTFQWTEIPNLWIVLPSKH